MFTYRINRALAVVVAAASLISLVWHHHVPLLEFRSATLLYSSILIAAISFFAQKNLVGQERYRRFGALLCLTSLGVYLTFLTTNLLILGLGWSASGLGAALLVNHANDRSSRKASRTIGAWFLLSDIALWSAIGLAHFNHIDPFAPFGSVRSTALITGIGALFALAGVVRSGLVPAMRWLIFTIEAPTPLSALLHAGIVNVFGYLLVALPIIQKVRPLVVGIGLLTILVSLTIMRHRHDEKGKLANGTSMQMAFMALEGVLGIPGIVLLHIVGHGSYKSWSFLRAGGAPLRRKNAMTIQSQGRKSISFIALFGALYIAIIAGGFWWVGRDFLLNIGVGAIALASVFIFAYKLNLLLAIQTFVTGLIGFFSYLGLLRIFAGFFPHTWEASFSLDAFMAASILLVTALFRFIPRHLTLRFASLLNGYQLGRRSLKHNIADNSRGNQIGTETLLEMVNVASSPFITGGALSEIVAQDSLAGLHHLDFGAASAVAAECGISMYQSSAQYLELLERGSISREVLGQALSESNLQVEELIVLTKEHAQGTQRESSSEGLGRIASLSGWWSSQAWFDGSVDRTGDAYTLWRKSLSSKTAKEFPADPLEALAQSLTLLDDRAHDGSSAST